ncbi:MAG: four helix bundle protein [Vicinamibacterales bacterium]|nr:four helix bundle protein [Vicinamibacterales bacterium]
MPKSLDDLQIYQKAVIAADAVFALLKKSTFQKDLDLRNQLLRSSASVPALIAEGFGQQTDRHFASYLSHARGSALESSAHLRIAIGRQYITEEEFRRVGGLYDEIGKMLTPFIHHLRSCDWKQRG